MLVRCAGPLNIDKACTLTSSIRPFFTGGEIQWNFTKFLVDRNGKVLQRFEPAVEPDSKEIEAAVEAALK